MVGLGPGNPATITGQAREALAASEVVVGYRTYVALAEEMIQGKEIIASPMTRELDRAGQAVDRALAGAKVALISSGDPGVYAMAAVVFELAKSRGLSLGQGGLRVEIVPGVAAVTAAASLLGAPLSHDFACISLSDRLTPWELIVKRLSLAAEADFVIALYNPKSKGRDWQFAKACRLVSEHRAPDTPVGIVGKAMRDGQSINMVRLAEAPEAAVDMQTLVIIGNSRSFIYQDRMVTPRGYIDKYGAQENGA